MYGTMKDVGDYITHEQAEYVINKIPILKHKAFFATLYYTGARVSEALLLKVKDINFKEGVIYMPTLKKRVKNSDDIPYRMIPMCDKLSDILQAYLRNRRSENSIVFDFTRQDGYYIINRWCKVYNIRTQSGRQVHPHTLRHSFAIRLAETSQSFGDIRRLQTILGHSNINTTMIYVNFSPSELKKAINQAFS